MNNKIIWLANSPNPDNTENFNQIRQWWESLADQKILFSQRLLPENENTEILDWTPQKFDNEFKLLSPRVGGITLYWQQPNTDTEHSITVRKLELNSTTSELFIYSQSQQDIVIRVTPAQEKYDTVEINFPQIAATQIGENYFILLRDTEKKVEVKLKLTPVQLDRMVRFAKGKGS